MPSEGTVRGVDMATPRRDKSRALPDPAAEPKIVPFSSDSEHGSTDTGKRSDHGSGGQVSEGEQFAPESLRTPTPMTSILSDDTKLFRPESARSDAGHFLAAGPLSGALAASPSGRASWLSSAEGDLWGGRLAELGGLGTLILDRDEDEDEDFDLEDDDDDFGDEDEFGDEDSDLDEDEEEEEDEDEDEEDEDFDDLEEEEEEAEEEEEEEEEDELEDDEDDFGDEEDDFLDDEDLDDEDE